MSANQKGSHSFVTEQSLGFGLIAIIEEPILGNEGIGNDGAIARVRRQILGVVPTSAKSPMPRVIIEDLVIRKKR